MPASVLELLTRDQPVLLDGGLATTLEERGHHLDDALWSARLLLDDPDEVIAAHRSFLASGAEVLITASYQLATASLSRAGHDPAMAHRLLVRSVELARTAIDQHDRSQPDAPGALVAGSVGPYGAVLADGSEYRGRYGLSVDELAAFHAPRVQALADAGVDLLACETVPSGDEIRALARVLDGIGTPAWISLTVGPSGRVTPEGQPLAGAVAPLGDVEEVVAIGVNCCPPDRVGAALDGLAALGRAMVAYPNLGARWDPAAMTWRPDAMPDAVAHERLSGWWERGATLIGGCCGTTPGTLADLGRRLREVAFPSQRSRGRG